jgi:hypothetical protein
MCAGRREPDGLAEQVPGMMDTVLNLALNDRAVESLAAPTGYPRLALDAYRRFVQMFAHVCRGISSERLEAAIAERKRAAGARDDSELSRPTCGVLVGDLRRIFEAETGETFPDDPAEQLRQAIRAVFDSWLGRRAVTYRRINHIPDEWGTACNVQQMVFGNKGDTSSPACGRRAIWPRCHRDARGARRADAHPARTATVTCDGRRQLHGVQPGDGYPNVKAYASAPGSKNVISRLRSRLPPFARTSW